MEKKQFCSNSTHWSVICCEKHHESCCTSSDLYCISPCRYKDGEVRCPAWPKRMIYILDLHQGWEQGPCGWSTRRSGGQCRCIQPLQSSSIFVWTLSEVFWWKIENMFCIQFLEKHTKGIVDSCSTFVFIHNPVCFLSLRGKLKGEWGETQLWTPHLIFMYRATSRRSNMKPKVLQKRRRRKITEIGEKRIVLKKKYYEVKTKTVQENQYDGIWKKWLHSRTSVFMKQNKIHNICTKLQKQGNKETTLR